MTIKLEHHSRKLAKGTSFTMISSMVQSILCSFKAVSRIGIEAQNSGVELSWEVVVDSQDLDIPPLVSEPVSDSLWEGLLKIPLEECKSKTPPLIRIINSMMAVQEARQMGLVGTAIVTRSANLFIEWCLGSNARTQSSSHIESLNVLNMPIIILNELPERRAIVLMARGSVYPTDSILGIVFEMESKND